MEWKNKIDESCADELEEMFIDLVKEGFLSNREILEECMEYMEEEYPDDCEKITGDELLEIIKMFRAKHQNTGNQENFLKLDAAFHSLFNQGIVALHYAGYTQDEGFDDCNEIATNRYNKGEKVIGCCFYTIQDLGHVIHEESTLLYLSFGNYFDKPNAEEVGQQIVKELEKAGFAIEWNGTANKKIAIKDFKWDKYYIDNE